MPGLNSSLYCTSELHNYLCLFLAGWYLSALDNVFLAIYFMEIVLKLYALRSFFFKTGWNIMGMTKRVFVFILGSQSCVGFSKYIEKLKNCAIPHVNRKAFAHVVCPGGWLGHQSHPGHF